VPPAVRQQILVKKIVNEGSLVDLKVHVRSITNSSHPACGQFGLFAGQKIPPKCHIIQYLGKHADLHALINCNKILKVKYIAMNGIRTMTCLFADYQEM